MGGCSDSLLHLPGTSNVPLVINLLVIIQEERRKDKNRHITVSGQDILRTIRPVLGGSDLIPEQVTRSSHLTIGYDYYELLVLIHSLLTLRIPTFL